MKAFERLGALGRQIRGWLPMEPVAAARGIPDRRGTFIAVTGAFLAIVGISFLLLWILYGPITDPNCITGMSCDSIEFNMSPITPYFLIVFGAANTAFGLHFRSRHETRAL
jgi:hypothetical protein